MRETFKTLRRVAATSLSILIVGEQGSGKEWAAYRIHQCGLRSDGPFHIVECGASSPEQLEKELFGVEAISWKGVDIRRSAFEDAASGTLLLEDIDLLPPPTQLKIAHALEYQRIRHIGSETETPIDIRLLGTLRRNGESHHPESALLAELLHRFSPVVIEIPPLRRRKEDVALLVYTFLDELRLRYGCAVEGISRKALEACKVFGWPGNIRQLRSAIEYAAIMSDGKTIQPQHLPAYVTSGENRGSTQG
jgi:DNA-binding NtrC family response regulator